MMSWLREQIKRIGGSQRGRQAPNLDYPLLLSVAGLLFIGLIAVYSSTFDRSYQAWANLAKEWSRQFLWAGLGLVVLVGFALLPYNLWRKYAIPIFGGGVLMLLLILLIAKPLYGSRRTFISGSIQPSEFVKLATVIYVATWLTSKQDRIRNITYGVLPFAMMIGFVAGLIVAQPDLSTGILIVVTASAMFFIAGADLLQIGIGAVGLGGVLYVLINSIAHAQERVDQYLAVLKDPLQAHHHTKHALIAIGSGGFFGVGLGQGQQKLGYLPLSHTDSIFAIIAEEMGFVGCFAVIVLYAILTYRGFRIAARAREPFAGLLASGITCTITFQAMINIAVMLALLPMTGISLPFISSGGSNLLVSLAGIGILLSIARGNHSKNLKRKKGTSQHANLDRRWGNRGTRVSRPRRRTGAKSHR